jgi:hypothetical protein
VNQPAVGYDTAVAVVYEFPIRDVDAALRRAIDEKRLITFTLHGLSRRAEPHDFGIVKGATKLFFYQVGGASRSGPPVGWRWAQVDEIQDLRLLDERFAGARESNARHVEWDSLVASVSRDPD